MKKILVGLLITLFMMSSVFAAETWPINAQTVGNTVSLEKLLRSRFAAIDDDIANLDSLVGTGHIFYVDKDVIHAGGNGQTWEYAVTTIDAAINLCTASRGDIIYVAQGHTETIVATGGITQDVIGLTIIGCGFGDLRPKITFTTATAADWLLAANNCVIANMIFINGINSQSHFILVTGDDCLISGCEFRDGASTSGLNAISIGAADGDSDRLKIQNCTFYQPGANNDAAIFVYFDMVGMEFTGNTIYGDYDLAAIYVPTLADACLNILIDKNVITNKQASGLGIYIDGTSSTLVLGENTVHVDTASNAYSFAASIMPAAGSSSSGGIIDGTGVYPTSVADDSLFAKLMSKSATPSASSYNNTTDSLEAIADSLVSATSLTDNNLDHLMLTAVANGTNMTTEVANNTVISNIMTTGGTTSQYARTTMSLQAISVAALAAQTAAEKLDTAGELQVLTGTAAVSTTGITSAPTEKTLADILHKDGAFTFDNTTDSLEALSAMLVVIDDFIDTEVAAILADTGTDGVVLATGAVSAGAVAEDAIDAGAIATDAIGSAEFAAAAVTKIWNNDLSAYATANYAGTYLHSLYDNSIAQDANLLAILDDTVDLHAHVDNINLDTNSLITSHVYVDAILDLINTDTNAIEADTVDIQVHLDDINLDTNSLVTSHVYNDAILDLINTDTNSIETDTVDLQAHVDNINDDTNSLVTSHIYVDTILNLINTDTNAIEEDTVDIQTHLDDINIDTNTIGDINTVLHTELADGNTVLHTDVNTLQVAALPTKNHPNYIVLNVDIDSADWNDVAAQEILDVTGACRVQIMIEVITTVITEGTTGTIALGFAGNASAIFTATSLDAALAGDVFSAAYGGLATTPIAGSQASTSNGVTGALFDVVVVGGQDIGYTITTNVAHSGALRFHIWWEPLSSDGYCVVGTGIAF